MRNVQSTQPILSFFKWIYRHLKRLLLLFVGANCLWCLSSYAQNPTNTIDTQSTYKISVSQYELALAQVLSEICPPMLNKEQQVKFYEAYQSQLKVFIPTSGDPNETLRYLSNQRNYQIILQNMRTWTASFPVQENQKLCQDFARKTVTF